MELTECSKAARVPELVMRLLQSLVAAIGLSHAAAALGSDCATVSAAVRGACEYGRDNAPLKNRAPFRGAFCGQTGDWARRLCVSEGGQSDRFSVTYQGCLGPAVLANHAISAVCRPMRKDARDLPQFESDCRSLAAAFYEMMFADAKVFCRSEWVSPSSVLDQSGAREAALAGTSRARYVMPTTTVLDQVPEQLVFVTARELASQMEVLSSRKSALERKSRKASTELLALAREILEMDTAFQYLSARYYTSSSYVGMKDQAIEQAVLAEVRQREKRGVLFKEGLVPVAEAGKVAGREEKYRQLRDEDESSQATGRQGVYYPGLDTKEWAHFTELTGLSYSYWFGLTVPDRAEIIGEFRVAMKKAGTVIGRSASSAERFYDGEARNSEVAGSGAYLRAQAAATRNAVVGAKARRACERLRSCGSLQEKYGPGPASEREVCRSWFRDRFAEVCQETSVSELPICLESPKTEPDCAAQ